MLEIRVIERRMRELTQKLHRVRRNEDSDVEIGSLVSGVRILDPVSGKSASLSRSSPPSWEEILRALPKEAVGDTPFLATTSRNNVRFIIEMTIDKLGPCRFYPLVGSARLHERCYKCTVYYDKITRSDWPVPFTHTDRVNEVVYINHDDLIRCAGPTSR
jgi:hypothetical protein